MTLRCTRSSTASGLCGALRLVASVQPAPGAREREREEKSLREGVNSVISPLKSLLDVQAHYPLASFGLHGHQPFS